MHALLQHVGGVRELASVCWPWCLFHSVCNSASPGLCFIISQNVSVFEKLNISLVSFILISVILSPRDIELCHGPVPSIAGICMLQGITDFCRYLASLPSSVAVLPLSAEQNKSIFLYNCRYFYLDLNFLLFALLVHCHQQCWHQWH